MAAAMSSTGANPHMVAGRTSTELFPDNNARALADAACVGNTEEIADLTHKYQLVNYRGVEGSSPLLWAISCKNLSGVKALLANGADPNQSAEGANPVETAALQEDPSILVALLDAGADPNRYADGTRVSVLRSALEATMHHHDDRSLRVLLERGADVNQPTEGDSIVEFAVSLNRFKEASLMLDYGYKGSLEDLKYYVRSYLKRGSTFENVKKEGLALMTKIESLENSRRLP